MIFLHPILRQLAVVFVIAFSVGARAAENITPLGKSPDWKSLERFQETITRGDFTRLLQTVYCTRGVADHLIKIGNDAARILIEKDTDKFFTLRFAKAAASTKPPRRAWRTAEMLALAPR